MQAVILAAGVGRRMKNLNDEKGDLPKCLLTLQKLSLLERHIKLLYENGIRKIWMVLGYRKADIIEHAEAFKKTMGYSNLALDYIDNTRYEEGSLLSMYEARDCMAADNSILMDADVLYSGHLIKKLLESRNDNCFLLDESAGASDEEMRLGAENGRIMTIKRGLPGGYSVIGEGVGFLKITAGDSRLLMDEARKLVEAGTIGDYEEAINNYLKIGRVGYELVDEPWMEIDFEEDVKRAHDEILPAIKKLENLDA